MVLFSLRWYGMIVILDMLVSDHTRLVYQFFRLVSSGCVCMCSCHFYMRVYIIVIEKNNEQACYIWTIHAYCCAWIPLYVFPDPGFTDNIYCHTSRYQMRRTTCVTTDIVEGWECLMSYAYRAFTGNARLKHLKLSRLISLGAIGTLLDIDCSLQMTHWQINYLRFEKCDLCSVVWVYLPVNQVNSLDCTLPLVDCFLKTNISPIWSTIILNLWL